jgi:hypothetical protein
MVGVFALPTGSPGVQFSGAGAESMRDRRRLGMLTLVFLRVCVCSKNVMKSNDFRRVPSDRSDPRRVSTSARDSCRIPAVDRLTAALPVRPRKLEPSAPTFGPLNGPPTGNARRWSRLSRDDRIYILGVESGVTAAARGWGVGTRTSTALRELKRCLLLIMRP